MGKKSKRRNPPSKNNKNKKKGQKKKGQGNQSASAPCGAGCDKRDRDGVDWTIHDDILNGMRLEINNEFATMSINNGGGKDANDDAPVHPKGSRDALQAALERAWSTDPAISNPYDVGLAMGPKDEWMEWAMPMVSDPYRLHKFWDEYNKDMDMHKSILKKMSKGMEEGSCECKDYIMALNCIFHDSFDRLSMDYPPFLNLQEGMLFMNFERIRHQVTEPVYKSHMKIWKGYENRAFQLMKVVQEHPLIPKPDPCIILPYDPYPPLKFRGEFPSAERRETWESDSSDDEYDDEYGSPFGAACGFSGAEVGELLSQGVKPWDDDAGAVLAALNGY